MRSKTGYANVKDTIIPLYPRRKARALCDPAVTGTVTAKDTTQWNDVKGSITVQADKLTTGLDMRDRYARESILNTRAYPTIKFTIDSLSHLTKARGDTLVGQAYGVFELHGITRPMNAAIKTWREPMGRRVTQVHDPGRRHD
jgi:polyisoprenoid-binding protein YceI